MLCSASRCGHPKALGEGSPRADLQVQRVGAAALWSGKGPWLGVRQQGRGEGDADSHVPASASLRFMPQAPYLPPSRSSPIRQEPASVTLLSRLSAV